MPSRLQRAVTAYRAAIEADDAAALLRLTQAYQAARRRLNQRITALGPLLAEDPTPYRVFADGRYRALLQQVDQELARLGGQLVTETTARQLAMVDRAGLVARGLTAAQAPELAASFATIPPEALRDLVGAMGDGSPLAETVGWRFGAFRREAEDALAAAIVQGQGPADLARTLLGLTDGFAATHVLSLARTEPLRAFRTASLRTYAENADILSGWRWVATLSPATCLACLAMHGTEHSLSEQFFASHVRCRCSPIPIVPGRRAPALESGQAWFDRQPEAKQRQQMGAAAYEAYRAGDVTFRDFLGTRHDRDWGPSVYERSLAEIRRGRDLRRAA
jgi:hypothetical protein